MSTYDMDYSRKASDEVPMPATDLSLSSALNDLRDVSAECAKAAEDFLIARDRWNSLSRRLDDVTAVVAKIRSEVKS